MFWVILGCLLTMAHLDFLFPSFSPQSSELENYLILKWKLRGSGNNPILAAGDFRKSTRYTRLAIKLRELATHCSCPSCWEYLFIFHTSTRQGSWNKGSSYIQQISICIVRASWDDLFSCHNNNLLVEGALHSIFTETEGLGCDYTINIYFFLKSNSWIKSLT